MFWEKCKCVSIPSAAGVHGGSPLVGSRDEALDASAILRYWTPKNIILDCSLPGEYYKKKQFATSKGWNRLDRWKVDNFFYFKNGLTYSNKKKQNNFLYIFL